MLTLTSLTFLAAHLRRRVRSRLARTMGDEAGEIASWVVVTALVVAAAVVIVGIVMAKLTATANNIKTS